MKKNLLALISVLILTSCEAIFVENISNKKITVISPVDGTELEDTKVVFSWDKVEDTDTYRLRVVTPDFNNATTTVIDTIITKSIFTKELSPGSYQWSIVGENAEYQTQETISSFVIK